MRLLLFPFLSASLEFEVLVKSKILMKFGFSFDVALKFIAVLVDVHLIFALQSNIIKNSLKSIISFNPSYAYRVIILKACV